MVNNSQYEAKELSSIIIDRIRKEGPITFSEFMEMSLYHPTGGYYMSGSERIGKLGDYYTSPELSSFYGHMIGKQLEEMWTLMDKPPFTIVEYGAGNGSLCIDILNCLKTNIRLFRELKYCIIEKSELVKKKQQQMATDKVYWIDDIEELNGITGCVLSNEVVDNFPVSIVIMDTELMEVYIDFLNEFTEVLKPASAAAKSYLAIQHISLPRKYRTEINLKATEWIQHIAANLKRGFVITVDYGFPSYEIYAPERGSGTLACYYKHCVGDSPYTHIGMQDITAYVNFSALHLWGKKAGLQFAGFCTQGRFMRSLGIASELREIEKKPSFHKKEISFQLRKLLFDIGDKFKVLIQQKGINAPLSGMRLASHSEASLI